MLLLARIAFRHVANQTLLVFSLRHIPAEQSLC